MPQICGVGAKITKINKIFIGKNWPIIVCILSKSFSNIFFHWSSYVIVAHDFAKIPLIHSYELSHNTNIIFLL